LAEWFKTVFMEDSENGGKGDMQARNRTVVNLPREKIEKSVDVDVDELLIRGGGGGHFPHK
jgi:hypothetical protein